MKNQTNASRNSGDIRFKPHMQRAASLGEIHARPHPILDPPRVVLHYAFMTEGGKSVDSAILGDLCRQRGESAPAPDSRFHELPWGPGKLWWERHSEFSTYAWNGPAPKQFQGPVEHHPFGTAFSAPGTMISGTRVEVRSLTAANRKLLQHFDPESLCITVLDDQKTIIATDFRQDKDGMTVFLLLEHKLDAGRIGFLVKTLIDLDTYRTLAMLGLPLAQSLSVKMSKTELELARLTAAIRDANADQGQNLLEDITALAADLEADAAASLFRFSASRAYGEIVFERIRTIGKTGVPDAKELGAFLSNRLSPALRTCRSIEERQANLSRKLARAANLLRTRVDVEIEQQNRILLSSMNRRAKLQLRLQHTVEGLSVVAVSYYLVGLFYYLAQAVGPQLPGFLTPKLLTGMFVPIAVLLVWSLVRSIRRKHSEQ